MDAQALCARIRTDLTDVEERIKANYKGNYERLVGVKRTYDPGNLFHLNQNIKP